jgi:hypothetical protein
LTPCAHYGHRNAGDGTDAGTAFPTARNPAFVYEIDIDPNDPRVDHYRLVDRVFEISKERCNKPLAAPSYHHNGDKTFLLSIVDPARFATYGVGKAPVPKGSANNSSVHSTSELDALVCALRDAEILFVGAIPVQCVIDRHDVW